MIACEKHAVVMSRHIILFADFIEDIWNFTSDFRLERNPVEMGVIPPRIPEIELDRRMHKRHMAVYFPIGPYTDSRGNSPEFCFPILFETMSNSYVVFVGANQFWEGERMLREKCRPSLDFDEFLDFNKDLIRNLEREWQDLRMLGKPPQIMHEAGEPIYLYEPNVQPCEIWRLDTPDTNIYKPTQFKRRSRSCTLI